MAQAIATSRSMISYSLGLCKGATAPLVLGQADAGSAKCRQNGVRSQNVVGC